MPDPGFFAILRAIVFNAWLSVLILIEKILAYVETPSDDPHPTFVASLKTIILSSWLNILLLFLPVSWSLYFAESDKHILKFMFTIICMIPLAKLLVFAADELTMQVGQVFAGLVDITLGVMGEAIFAIIAISKEDFVIVQSSFIGTILCNLLLVPGFCFFVGGIKFSEQRFGTGATQMDSSLITIGVITILVPTFLPSSVTATDPNSEQDVKVGRGVSIVSFTIYLAYLFFRLWSHAKIYAATSGESTSDNSHTANSNTITTTIDGSGNKEKAVPRLNACMALVLLVLAAALLAFTAEWLVVSIDGLTGSSNISKKFLSTIILPIIHNGGVKKSPPPVSNRASSCYVSLGTIIQTTCVAIPLTIVVAWAMGKSFILRCDVVDICALSTALFVFSHIVQNGKSNWLKGLLLIALYAVLSAVFFVSYPPAGT